MFNLPRMHKKLVSISFFRIDIAILLGILYTTYRSKRERTRLILTYQCLYIRFPPFLALAYVKSRFGFSKVVNYMLAAFLCAELYSAMRRQCNGIFPLHRRMQASSKGLSGNNAIHPIYCIDYLYKQQYIVGKLHYLTAPFLMQT